MTPVRIFAELTLTDLGKAPQLLEALGRTVRHIERNLPRVLAWEAHLDEATGKVTVYEEHEDDKAFSEYEASLESNGVAQKMMSLMKIDRVVVLGRVEDPDALALLQQLGVAPLASSVALTI